MKYNKYNFYKNYKHADETKLWVYVWQVSHCSYLYKQKGIQKECNINFAIYRWKKWKENSIASSEYAANTYFLYFPNNSLL
jgi:hypothetical protein